MIDDHVLLRNGVAKMINEFPGFEVCLQANNGKEFIELIKTQLAPEIVLLDINMPIMSGYETAAWISKNLPRTKMLVLSMIDTEYVYLRMLRLGARGFMYKDSHPEQFHQALIELRDKGIYMNVPAQNEGNPPVDPAILTAKETGFLRLVCSEMTYREIASQMHISYRTADSYRDTLFDKLGVTTRVGLVLYAIKNGIVMI